MTGWIILLVLIALLAVLPLGVSARYDAGGPLVRLIVGPLRFTLYPAAKKAKKEKKAGTKAKTGHMVAKADQTGQQSAGSVTDFIPIVRYILDFLVDFRRKIRVNMLELKLTLAGDDPCDLAVNYGRAWAALGNLLPQLERFFIIKKRDLQVQCDFTADQTVIYARLDITITLGRLLCIAVHHGTRVLREFLRIMKTRKGGALQ